MIFHCFEINGWINPFKPQPMPYKNAGEYKHKILLLISIYVVVSYWVPLDASSTFDRRLTQSESIWPLSEPTFSGRAAVSLCMHSILTPRRHRDSTTKSSQVGSHHLLRPTTAYTILYSQIARMITKLQKKLHFLDIKKPSLIILSCLFTLAP